MSPYRRRRDLINRPTRDLNDGRVWSGGSRDFDERSGTNRPGHRGGRGGGRRGRREQRGWWDEPRRSEPSRPTEFSDRLSSDAERMRLLTGEADPQYGRREDYDPQDRQFNRQFDDAPRGRQPWDSDRRDNPLERDPLEGYDYREGRDVSRPTRRRRSVPTRPSTFDPEVGPGKKYPYGKPDPSHPPNVVYSKGPTRPSEPRTDDIVYAGGGSPIEGVSGHDYVNNPQYRDYDDSSIKQRLRDLENRKPQVTPATQDLSGITGRLSELENKPQTSSWQENRIAALEGRQPQDLSGITGRLSELEGKAPSWQEDRIKQLEGGRTEGRSARDLLDQRLASLENYYKNDPPPPPEESTGNRYEDKQAQLNKMWEQTGNVYDPEAFAVGNPWTKSKDEPASWLTGDREGDYVRNKDWHGTGSLAAESWTNRLPETYRKQMRDLDKEYNKPSHSAIIKGREYTAYGPAQKARLEMLDQQNIHEDEYLGHGTWENKFGEEITGRGKAGSEKKRYFASHSGLDPEGEEYAKRFRRQGHSTSEGDLTNYYKQSQEGSLDPFHQQWWKAQGGYKPEEHGKYGWGVVGTNRSKTGQTKWDEAYYPELG